MLENVDFFNLIIATNLKTILEKIHPIIIILLFITYQICNNFHKLSMLDVYYNKIKNYFHKISCITKNKNTVIYEASRSVGWDKWVCVPKISTDYTNEFISIVNFLNQHSIHLKENITKNLIHELKYIYTKVDEQRYGDDNNDITNNFYIISQSEDFIFTKDIYANIEIIDHANEEDKNGKVNSKKMQFIIELYSYKLTFKDIKTFIDDLTYKHLQKIKEEKKGKRYIYKLMTNSYDESIYDCWKETLFNTTRSFNNIFFEKKQDFVNKIDFFLNNEKWYYDKGMPYSLGLALHGEPGTGKTSLIKALANYTNRHIILLSFKLIKTVKDLDMFFYEDRYKRSNDNKSIDFKDKIIVFEDIDCADNIVYERDNTIIKKDTSNNNIKKMLDNNEKLKKDNTIDSENNKTELFSSSKILADPLTLDDILNVFDGIRETPGRIIVVTTNHYEKLDKALKRPGRIDINMKLDYITNKIFKNMYYHFFEIEYKGLIDDINLYEKQITPAQITNLFTTSNNNKNTFETLIKELLK